MWSYDGSGGPWRHINPNRKNLQIGKGDVDRRLDCSDTACRAIKTHKKRVIKLWLIPNKALISVPSRRSTLPIINMCWKITLSLAFHDIGWEDSPKECANKASRCLSDSPALPPNKPRNRYVNSVKNRPADELHRYSFGWWHSHQSAVDIILSLQPFLLHLT